MTHRWGSILAGMPCSDETELPSQLTGDPMPPILVVEHSQKGPSVWYPTLSILRRKIMFSS